MVNISKHKVEVVEQEDYVNQSTIQFQRVVVNRS